MIHAPLLAAFLLCGCDSAPGENGDNAPTRGEPAAGDAVPAKYRDAATLAERDPARVDDDGPPDPAASPPELVPAADRGEKGARNLLLEFARSLEHGQFDAAWSLLSAADRNKWPLVEFSEIFDDLDELTVAVPTGKIEGAAGSSYYRAPIAITGADEAGRPVRIEGIAGLRRINDIEGAEARRPRWHFETLTLAVTH